MHSLGHRPHPLGVASLDLEVVGGVQRQLLDLVGQPVAHYGFDHPVVDLCVYVRAVVDDITYSRHRALETHYFN